MKYVKSCLIITMLLVVGYSQSVHLEIQNVNLSEGTLDIYMENDTEIGGFSIDIFGITIGDNAAYGGRAEEAEFTMSTGTPDEGAKILGFSLTGTTIPPGEGILFSLSFSDPEDEICTPYIDESNCVETLGEECDPFYDWTPLISDPYGIQIMDVTAGDCYENDDNWVYGCTYDTATNYNSEATFDDGSCDFMWGDVNHDGILTIQDLILIVNEILNF